MKSNLTTSQQVIIDSLTNEFTLLNTPEPTMEFSIFNAKALCNKVSEINRGSKELLASNTASFSQF